MNSRRILSQIALVTGALLLSIGVQTFAAFTAPTTAPPGADAYAPLHTGSDAQSKVGGLLLNTGGATNGLIVQSGNVGIGISSPSQQLDVAGYVRAASGLCIGSDCRTSWPAANETDPTVPAWAKSSNPTIPGTLSVSGTIQASGGIPIYQCPDTPGEEACAGGWTGTLCHAQLTTNITSCMNYVNGNCERVACPLVGRMVAP